MNRKGKSDSVFLWHFICQKCFQFGFVLSETGFLGSLAWCLKCQPCGHRQFSSWLLCDAASESRLPRFFSASSGLCLLLPTAGQVSAFQILHSGAFDLASWGHQNGPRNPLTWHRPCHQREGAPHRPCQITLRFCKKLQPFLLLTLSSLCIILQASETKNNEFLSLESGGTPMMVSYIAKYDGFKISRYPEIGV